MSREFHTDRIVALSPVTNAVLKNSIALQNAVAGQREIEVLDNLGSASLIASLKRNDVHLFVDEPLLFINDLYKIDQLIGDRDIETFIGRLEWIATRLQHQIDSQKDEVTISWVYDYPERHLGQFLGTTLPLDRQTRSSELGEMLLYLLTISSVVAEHKETLLRVYLNYGLDSGWQVMPAQFFTLSKNLFSKIEENFPNHSVFKSNAFSTNSNSASNVEKPLNETILMGGALECVRLLDQFDLSRGQEYANFYKEMLNRTLQTSTILLDSAAGSQAAIAQKEDFEERFRNLQRVNERQREIFEALVKLSKGLK